MAKSIADRPFTILSVAILLVASVAPASRALDALATSAGTPGPSPGAKDCVGLTAQTLRPDPSLSRAQGDVVGRSFQEASGCRWESELFLSASADPAKAATCEMLAVPEPLDKGVQIRVTHTGDCSGVISHTVISQQQERVAQAVTARPFALYHKAVDARIIGYDTIHYPMFIVSAQLDWDYDYGDVYNGVFGQYNWDDQWWYLAFQTLGSMYGADGMGISWYYRYNYSHYHSDGFPYSWSPDTDGWAQPTAYGYSQGSHSCDYWYTWEDPYPDFAWLLSCGHNP